MHKILTSAIVTLVAVLWTGLAQAQTFDPVIAYGQVGGRSSTVNIANENASKVVSLFSTRNGISEPDLSPNGGAVVFGDGGSLRLLTFSVSSSSATLTGNTVLDSGATRVWKVDYSADGQRVLYIADYAGGIRRLKVANISGGSSILNIDATEIMDASFRGSSSVAYFQRNAVDNSREVYFADLDVSNQLINNSMVFTTAGTNITTSNTLALGHVTNRLLINGFVNSVGSVIEVDLDTATHRVVAAGQKACYSPDDQRAIYLSPNSDQLRRVDLSTGAVTNLYKKGSYTGPDWRE